MRARKINEVLKPKKDIQDVLKGKPMAEVKAAAHKKLHYLSDGVLDYLLDTGWNYIGRWQDEPGEPTLHHEFKRNGAEIIITRFDDLDTVKRFVSDTHL